MNHREMFVIVALAGAVVVSVLHITGCVGEQQRQAYDNCRAMMANPAVPDVAKALSLMPNGACR